MDFLKFQTQFTDFISKNSTNEVLCRELFPGGELTIDEALGVYQMDYTSRLKEALGKNYESTWLLLGDEEFYHFAEEYIKCNPSTLPNLTLYGEHFPNFLKNEGCDEEVIQMAEFEKKYWYLFHCEDQQELILNEKNLSESSFDLTQVGLFSSSVRLDILWANREAGFNNNEEPDLYQDCFFALVRTQKGVEIINLEKREIYQTLQELTHVQKITELSQKTPAPSPEDWSVILKVIKYSRFIV